MKKIVIAFMGLSLLSGGAAFAKGSFVPGAKCTACHEGKPSDKKLNAKAQEMLKKHGNPEKNTAEQKDCKECHGKAEGDKAMTTTHKEK